MVEQDGVQVFASELDASLTVVIVYPESEKYEQVLPQFEKSGHAFLLHDAKMMVVDGAAVLEPWFSKDHLFVIQAHELGHYRAGHGKNAHSSGNTQIEKEADWIGWKLLQASGLTSAAQLHFEEYEARYDRAPDSDSIEFEETLGKFTV